MEASQKVSKAVVYRDGVFLSITRDVQWDAGVSDLVIRDLPTSLDAESLQIVFPEGVDWQLLNRQVSQGEEDEADPEVEKLEDELDALKKEKEQIAFELSQWEQKASYSERLSTAFIRRFETQAETEDGDPLELAESIWAFQEQNQKAAREETLKLREALKPLAEKEVELREALGELQQQKARLRSIITLRLKAATAGTGTLGVEFFLAKAGWNPEYQVHVDPLTRSLRWGYAARIRQESGLDWEGIVLEVSDRRVRSFRNDPVLPPLVLQPGYQGGAAYLSRSKDFAQTARPAEAEIALGEVDSGSLGFTFQFQEPMTVAGNGEWMTFFMMEKQAEAEIWTEWVVGLSVVGMMKAEFENPFAVVMLPGRVQIFNRGKSLGESPLQETLPGEKRTLLLGPDEAIRVVRVTQKETQRQAGLIDKITIHERTYRTTVENFSPETRDIRVTDRFPTARENPIQIKRHQPDEDEVTFDEERPGVFTWKFSLEPSAARELVTRFEVIHPLDWDIGQEF